MRCVMLWRKHAVRWSYCRRGVVTGGIVSVSDAIKEPW